MKKRVKIEPDLINNLDKFALDIRIGSATKIRDDLTQTTHDVIMEFYNHYKTPESYKRTPEHANLLNSFHKYYKNPHDTIVRGGVVLSPEDMDQLYRASKEYVFNEVYLGMHGNIPMLPQYNPATWVTPPTMTPRPLFYIMSRRDYIVDNIVNYTEDIVKKAQKTSYKYIKFRSKRKK